MVFSYSEYYPSGGLSDVVDSFDNLEDAEKCFAECGGDSATIFDRINGIILLIVANWCISAVQRLGGMGGDAGLADCFTLKNFQNEKDTTTLHFCNRLRLAV